MEKQRKCSQKRKNPRRIGRKEPDKVEFRVMQRSNGKFTDQQFGELNLGKVGNVKVYCLSDVYRILGILHKEGENILEKYGCYTVPLLVKRRVITRSYLFTDYDGILTILIETRKTKANAFKRWIDDKERACDICEAGEKLRRQEEKFNNKPLTDDMYPTLGAYFRDYVPIEYFSKVVDETIEDFKRIPRRNEKEGEEIEFRAGVLTTFRDTLKANISGTLG